ncbi:hypothetical protein Bpfe_009547 [Biomphalaria pfeifferi]|uniref:Uncharacterized protein n=1 Tax=Biomphalaria pfeifferi TaxID=112525 RepID=A0AAD8BUC7_BIOPF|nr:hypothetical protein Bpfe_009547 [Biomphalaria pfeifferi]
MTVTTVWHSSQHGNSQHHVIHHNTAFTITFTTTCHSPHHGIYHNMAFTASWHSPQHVIHHNMTFTTTLLHALCLLYNG